MDIILAVGGEPRSLILRGSIRGWMEDVFAVNTADGNDLVVAARRICVRMTGFGKVTGVSIDGRKTGIPEYR